MKQLTRNVLHTCGLQPNNSSMSGAFSNTVVHKIRQEGLLGFSRNLAVLANFSHTSLVINGGSITTMSKVPTSSAGMYVPSPSYSAFVGILKS